MHTRAYVDAVRTGEPRALAESQKFPWSPQLYPSVLLTGGGCLAAARRALRDGVAAAVVSGFHHAHADHGEGFCTFNSLVVDRRRCCTPPALRARRRARHGPALRQRHRRRWRRRGRTSSTCRSTATTTTRTPPSATSTRCATPTAPTTSRSRCPTAAAAPSMLAALERGRAPHPRLGTSRPAALPGRRRSVPRGSLLAAGLDHDDLRERDRRVFDWARARSASRSPGCWPAATPRTRRRWCACTSTPSTPRSRCSLSAVSTNGRPFRQDCRDLCDPPGPGVHAPRARSRHPTRRESTVKLVNSAARRLDGAGDGLLLPAHRHPHRLLVQHLAPEHPVGGLHRSTGMRRSGTTRVLVRVAQQQPDRRGDHHRAGGGARHRRRLAALPLPISRPCAWCRR